MEDESELELHNQLLDTELHAVQKVGLLILLSIAAAVLVSALMQ